MDSKITLREIGIEDYCELISLWRNTEGLGINKADDRQSIAQFLQRNAGYSFAATYDGKIVGTILCGHDGRRGNIYHLMVSDPYSRQGVGKELVKQCVNKLKEAGIGKCNLSVFPDNIRGRVFWQHIGFYERTDLVAYSKDL